MSSQEVVGHYKGLAEVERAFRSLKSVDLKLRPIYHHQPDRVRAHVFLCMLAYYVEWHMREARSEEHTSELQSHLNLVCRLLLEKKKKKIIDISLVHEEKQYCCNA